MTDATDPFGPAGFAHPGGTVPTLSTGQPSVLGVWRDLCASVFGGDSEATRFLDRKIAASAHGRDEAVLGDERQLLLVLRRLNVDGMRVARPPEA